MLEPEDQCYSVMSNAYSDGNVWCERRVNHPGYHYGRDGYQWSDTQGNQRGSWSAAATGCEASGSPATSDKPQEETITIAQARQLRGILAHDGQRAYFYDGKTEREVIDWQT